MAAPLHPITVPIADGSSVSGLLCLPEQPRACLVLAHGAGAGMDHPFMAAVAEGLARRAVATLRFQFPFIERGSKRPDAPPVARAAVRAAVAEARRRLPDVALFAGGKSFGGRMTSQAQAEARLEGVRGLVFLGFPLHPAGKPSQERAAHLREVRCPMLFLQGTRDELADVALLREVLKPLAERVTLEIIDDADHSFHVRARSGRTDDEVREAMVDAMVAWFDR
jgi:predicted alpha/beta-hydrolase family hydrolase